MAFKTASVTLDGSNLRFVARTGSGHSIVLDDGRGDTGPRPAELIPVALAACTAMDVISILRKKRQQVTRYEVRADGVQEDGHPNAFTRIDVLHVVDGPAVDIEALRRAIEHYIEDPLSEEILKGEFQGMDTVAIEVKEVGDKKQLCFRGSAEKPAAEQPTVAAESEGGATTASATSA